MHFQIVWPFSYVGSTYSAQRAIRIEVVKIKYQRVDSCLRNRLKRDEIHYVQGASSCPFPPETQVPQNYIIDLLIRTFGVDMRPCSKANFKPPLCGCLDMYIISHSICT